MRNFIVFFGFDKWDLAGAALPVVQPEVQTARATGVVRIVMTGHTDTVGSRTYNRRLSEHRADIVKAQMVHEGLNANAS